jgi:hypothetical protein
MPGEVFLTREEIPQLSENKKAILRDLEQEVYITPFYNAEEIVDKDTLNLMECIKNGDYIKFDAFISLGLNINGNLGFAPLHYAALKGDINFAKYIVETYKADINLRALSYFRTSPIFFAYQYNHLDIVHYLLDKGATPEIDIEVIGAGNDLTKLNGEVNDILAKTKIDFDYTQQTGIYHLYESGKVKYAYYVSACKTTTTRNLEELKNLHFIDILRKLLYREKTGDLFYSFSQKEEYNSTLESIIDNPDLKKFANYDYLKNIAKTIFAKKQYDEIDENKILISHENLGLALEKIVDGLFNCNNEDIDKFAREGYNNPECYALIAKILDEQYSHEELREITCKIAKQDCNLGGEISPVENVVDYEGDRSLFLASSSPASWQDSISSEESGYESNIDTGDNAANSLASQLSGGSNFSLEEYGD